jgi:membrane protein implicated in regulation of membrane protease activity
MEASTIWWVLAAGLVIAELLTGTVYLLALAVGAAAGALAAHAGASELVQIVIAAAVGAASALLWHFSKARQSRVSTVSANASTDVNQDVGAQVSVESWNPDGTAQVRYRGAQWTVRAESASPQPGQHRVTQVQGNQLIVVAV